ncbi:MAG: membrane protein insertase YidC [Campylobacterales bacterium]
MKQLTDMTPQTRILIATVIALLFFIPYSYFFTPEPAPKDETTKTEQSSTATTDSNSAPASSSAPNSTPESSAPISEVDRKDIIASINSEHYTVSIDKLGRISQVTLKDERFLDKSDRSELGLFSPDASPKPLEIRFANPELNAKAFEIPYSSDKSEIDIKNDSGNITLTQNLDGVVVKKIITFHNNGSYNLKVETTTDDTYFLYPGSTPNTDDDMFAFRGAIVGLADETLEKFEDGDFTQNTQVYEGTNIAASVDRYYASILFKEDSTFESIVSRGKEDNPQISIRTNGNYEINGYIGPKQYETLKSIDSKLTSIVDYGFITFFAKPLFIFLMYLEGLVGNWGWAIVLLTLVVRIILYPLTYKGMVSMQKLKDLAPKIKELQRKYKDDKQKLQMHMMDMYKKNGANPLGGCLPILLQMPIFFAIYMVLYNAIELKGAGWIFWINDLSVMDPYYILPILMGGSMYLHQVLTPTTFQDPLQEKLFKFLPLIFTFFFLTFPSGLVLYWFVNNLFSIAQQWIINKSFEKKRAKKNEQEV